MEITFDIAQFEKRPQQLISVMCNLARVGAWIPSHVEEIEVITCRTPSSAYKYVRYVTGKIGVSAKTEAVFLKNPNIGLRYLRMVNRNLQDEKIHARFWKKVVKKPELALEWARNFNQRLSEKEEEVFVKNMRCMWQYAQYVIGGRFPESVHNMILLKSYEKMPSYENHAIQEYIKKFGK